MKKFTLISACALTAIAANAQYTVNPETSVVAAQKPATVEWLILDKVGQQDLTAAGANLQYIGPDDEGRNLWIWDNTFSAGDSTFPGVDEGEDGYLSLVVGNVGWSGAGYNIRPENPDSQAKYQGADLKMFNDNTRFHVAYMSSTGNAPASLALIICDGEAPGSAPAKFAVGTAFNDGGVIYPTIGPAITDDWQGVDISFADIKKVWPTFNLAGLDNWYGNIVSFLGGGVSGQTFSLDCLYFYNLDEDSSVEGILADNADFVVTAKTINLNGANGMELYDLSGKLVKKTEGCVLGIDSLAKGVYIVKSGKKARKVVVK